MENKKSINFERGSAGLIVIIAIILLIIGAGAYLYTRTPSIPEKNDIGKTNETAGETGETGSTEVAGAVSDIEVPVPEMNFSSSPLPDLSVSSLNVSVAQISTGNIFSAPSVDSDFSYKSDVKISAPNPVINFEMPSIPIPTGIPGNVNIPSGTPSVPPANIPTVAAQPSVTGQPQTDCSQFASVPACSYVGAPGSQGYEACKQCYPSK